MLDRQNLDPCLEVGRFRCDGEIDRLKHDKDVLMAEVVKLRQEQQTTRAHLRAMEERLHNAEQKQHQMMGFLARAVQSPDFLQQLVQQQERRKELEEAMSKKRRRPIDRVPYHDEGETNESQDFEAPFGIEAEEIGSLYGPEVSELESLALEIQDLSKSKDEDEEEEEDKPEFLVSLARSLSRSLPMAPPSDLSLSSTQEAPSIAMSLSPVFTSGFARLYKGLSGVLFLGYLLTLIFPWTLNYLALVPANTFPFVWNIITAGYLEQSIFGIRPIFWISRSTIRLSSSNEPNCA